MKTILVPVDLSKNSAEATQYAFLFAEKTDRKLLFFHSTFVMIPTSSSMDEYQAAVEACKKAAMEEMKKFIDDLYASRNLTRNDQNTRFLVKYGPSVVHNILELTQEHFIDLIIIGTHGASGLKKAFMGSNTSKLIEQSYCPVLAIPEKFKYSKIESIAFGSSDLHELKKELKNVIPIAQRLSASIEVFHIMNDTDKVQDDPERMIDEIKKLYHFEKITIETIEKSDKPLPETIQDYIKRVKPGVLAMLTHKRSFVERLFHPSKTSEIAYHPTIPLLVLK